ncbi:hypothetical protein [Muricoccus radiodurans]|uniref:hypothetical protein n=1 Tax=Muricoccus radiodurans TaxID=2231721 RepID=UPI003CF4204B
MTVNGPTYAMLYLLLLIPTYLLPWFGSNSFVVFLATFGTNGLFWVHLLALLAICWLARERGRMTGQGWLVVLPVLALCFDMIPGLNLIPLVPTVLHGLAILLGLAPARRTA